MLFKSLRRRSTTSKTLPSKSGVQLQDISSSLPNSNTSKAPVLSTMTSQECRDYEEFLERARKEEEKKEKALEKAVKDADKRRRMMDMDPWARRAGGW